MIIASNFKTNFTRAGTREFVLHVEEFVKKTSNSEQVRIYPTATALDNFELVTLKGITQSFTVIKNAIKFLEKNIFPKSQMFCEPFMSKRGLYPTISKRLTSGITKKIMNYIQYSDGKNSIADISRIIKTNKKNTAKIYQILKKNKILY